MNAAYVYLQIYRMFDRSTPLKVNCGDLCGSICCKGEDCGMYLFPGEEEVYKLLSPDWVNIEKSDFTYSLDGKVYHTPLAVCQGKCDRYERPLACRIFPLTPYINSKDELEIVTDPRAKRLCPLAKAFYLDEFESDFLNNIRKSFLLLMKNKRVRAFLKEYSLYLDDFFKFYK